MHLLFFFSLQRWNPSICHSSILSPCALLLLRPCSPQNPQKEGFWCRVEKSSQEKKWFRPTQPFVFPLNKGSDKACAWCTSVAGTGARRSSVVGAQLCFTANRVFFTVASATPDEDIMFYSTQLLQVSTWFALACFGEKGSGDALKSSSDTRDIEAPFRGMWVWSDAPVLHCLNQSCKRERGRLKERAESNPPSPLQQFPKEISDYRQEGELPPYFTINVPPSLSCVRTEQRISTESIRRSRRPARASPHSWPRPWVTRGQPSVSEKQPSNGREPSWLQKFLKYWCCWTAVHL